jgi:hypothetical protein
MGVDEGLLDCILGTARSDDAAAVAQQRRAVAVDDRGEGRLVAIEGELYEAFVALQPQQRRPREPRGVAQQL